MAENTNNENGEIEGLEEDGVQHVRLAIKRQLPVQRIDKYLKNRFKYISRTMIQRLIQEEAVTVNERPTKASYQLKGGDRVYVLLPPPPPPRAKRASAALLMNIQSTTVGLPPQLYIPPP